MANLLFTQSGAAPDRLQLRSFLAALPAAGELGRSAAARGLAACGKIKLMEHRRKEWGELEAQAMYLLEHPHLLPEQKELGKFHLALRLWHYPAFEPYTVWLVYRGVRDEKSCLLREVVWDRPDEAERMLNPLEGLKRGFHTTPTFRIKTVELVRDEIDSRLAKLQRISLPLFIGSNTIGIDGETFGIAVGTGFLDAQASWWCNGPQEWQEVISWFNQTKAYLVAQLEENQTRG